MNLKIVTLIVCICGEIAGGRAFANELHPLLAAREPGHHALRVLTPEIIELEFVEQLEAPSSTSSSRILASPGRLITADISRFEVRVEGAVIPIKQIGWKRRAEYAALDAADMRVATKIYLELENALGPETTVEVRNPDGLLWSHAIVLRSTIDPMRLSPVIHVNHAGYQPAMVKKAIIGYYLGTLGELAFDPTVGFVVMDIESDRPVFSGPLRLRKDQGYQYAPKPYQSVYEADFSDFRIPGVYRIMIPGIGASSAFRIDDSIVMGFARAYALGLYHQGCGMAKKPPFTRFTHEACHTKPVTVPIPQEKFAKAWEIIARVAEEAPENKRHTAPRIRSPADQLYPFINKRPIEVSGGHHDAGDYSKYTSNSATLVHTLIFAVDSLPGVADLDNLGLPWSADGISDVLQIAKWELDFLAKMQDSDGGFYFLVYPEERRYESNVLPDKGDPQIVWPKNTAVTAAATAALAQASSSPLFVETYPQEAARYRKQAELGWRFLMDAIKSHGRDGAYQRVSHYSDLFMHDDELAWAAAELFLATGDQEYHRDLIQWFDPASPETRRWGWWRLSEAYGNAIRSYAFGVRSGRVAADDLNRSFYDKCIAEIESAGLDVARRSEDSAYGTSFPEETKRMRAGGWYFSLDQAFDLTVALQLDYPKLNDPRQRLLNAFFANLNFEAGTNPENISYVTGIGSRQLTEIVHQYARNDRRSLPPSGIPVGNLQAGLPSHPPYKLSIAAHSFPSDGATQAPFPYYDRWTDTHNVTTEFTIVNQARALAALAFVAGQTPAAKQSWIPQNGRITDLPERILKTDKPLIVRFEPPGGMDLNDAVVLWEAHNHEVHRGLTFHIIPQEPGEYWIEAEAYWPDGRRVVATETFNVIESSMSKNDNHAANAH